MATADTLAISEAIGQIALAALEDQDRAKIIAAGVKVRLAVYDFREKHPEQVPTRVAQSLLSLPGDPPIPVPDFVLARHLVNVADPGMTRLRFAAGDMNILLAYLLVEVCLHDRPPVHIGLDEALQYAVTLNGVSLSETRDQVRRMQPLAKHGEKFTVNRKKGHLSPVASKIKAHMRAHPRDTAVEVWKALARRPPKEHEFRDSPHLGRYIERDVKTVMAWPRFRNLVSEHRPKK